jgi:hypothetical protein
MHQTFNIHKIRGALKLFWLCLKKPIKTLLNDNKTLHVWLCMVASKHVMLVCDT